MRRAVPDRAATADALGWLGLVGAGLALTALAVAADLQVGLAGAPFAGSYRVAAGAGTLLAPLVAAGVLAVARPELVDRVRWGWLLAAAWAGAVAWSVALALVDGGHGLAGPVAHPAEYLADVPAVGDDPAGFVRSFVDRSGDWSVATRTHPPGPVLLLWTLGRLGCAQPLALGIVLTLLGCLAVPLVAVAVRSLCGERAARRLLPALVLAPYAVWVAVSMDGVVAALGAGFVACAVVASEPGRRPWWALGAGLLLGVAALFSYAVGWLAVVPLVVCFRRRRVATIALTGVAALVPLGLVRALGFVWPDGLTAAQADWSVRVGPHRSWLLWAALDLVVLVVACGPLVVTAARRLRRSPGWPFVLGAAVAVGFAIGSGLSRGEVERSWLPFFPWLLVPAVAADRDGEPALPSRWLLGLGALGAIVVEAVLRTVW